MTNTCGTVDWCILVSQSFLTTKFEKCTTTVDPITNYFLKQNKCITKCNMYTFTAFPVYYMSTDREIYTFWINFK